MSQKLKVGSRASDLHSQSVQCVCGWVYCKRGFPKGRLERPSMVKSDVNLVIADRSQHQDYYSKYVD
jgi:hypothetical protein